MHLKQLRRRQRCKQRRCKTTGTHAKKAHLLEMLELTPNRPDNLGATKMILHDKRIQNQTQFAKKNDRSIVCFFSPSFFFFVMRTSYTTKRFLGTPGYGASAFLSREMAVCK
jgi:hypothetical protein